MGRSFIEKLLFKRSNEGVLSPMHDGDTIALTDLIAGKLPTLLGWTTDPTDAANITDGDITTFCTTGENLNAPAWNRCHFVWYFGGVYDVMISGYGKGIVSAGLPYVDLRVYDGASWVYPSTHLNTSANPTPFVVSGCQCSGVSLSLCSTADATITPDIREFCVWRLK